LALEIWLAVTVTSLPSCVPNDQDDQNNCHDGAENQDQPGRHHTPLEGRAPSGAGFSIAVRRHVQQNARGYSRV
jgi:hypothetical protein